MERKKLIGMTVLKNTQMGIINIPKWGLIYDGRKKKKGKGDGLQ